MVACKTESSIAEAVVKSQVGEYCKRTTGLQEQFSFAKP